MIKFTIHADPVAQGRPRFANRGKFVTVYDDKKSKDWKVFVAAEAKSRGYKPLEGPLRMVLTFQLHRPKSAPKSRIWPIVKPDLSNYIKGIEDALNEICYHDDSQIVVLESRKEYACPGDPPGVVIFIEELK